MKSYNYKKRKGVKRLSWMEIKKYSKCIAEHLLKKKIDIIVGIARGGLFPATYVACMMRTELFPVRITRRRNDKIVSNIPEWKVMVRKNSVKGKTVAIIDEIADSGETLKLVKESVRNKGAEITMTCSLVTHSWTKPKPDYYCLNSDDLIIFPWDAEVYSDGKWQLHPELVETVDKWK